MASRSTWRARSGRREPRGLPGPISRIPQEFIDASHPAGCRTLFKVAGALDVAGTLHVPLGYDGETKAFGEDMAKPIIAAIKSGTWYWSRTNTIWGATANICVPLTTSCSRSGPRSACSRTKLGLQHTAAPTRPGAGERHHPGDSLQSQVAAFRSGTAFIAVPGEAFPFTFFRGFLGPQDMPIPDQPLPQWPLPSMHARFRFFDGLAEDMLGYIFPAGNAVGTRAHRTSTPRTPTASGAVTPTTRSRRARRPATSSGCAGELLNAHSGAAETIAEGGTCCRTERCRAIRSAARRSMRRRSDLPLRGSRGGGEAVERERVKPLAWMSLSGLPQSMPDRDTRGYFDQRPAGVAQRLPERALSRGYTSPPTHTGIVPNSREMRGFFLLPVQKTGSYTQCPRTSFSPRKGSPT